MWTKPVGRQGGSRLIVAMLLAIPLFAMGLFGSECPFNTPPPDDNSNTNDNTNPPGSGDTGLTGKYVGSERCSQCHSRIHENWAETLHGRALEALEDIGQDTNTECIGCHVVGYGEDGGFVDRATTNALAGVGCEECHGPGKDHVDNVEDETLRPVIDISASICGRCHTGNNHPNYEDWQQAGHSMVTEVPAEDFTAGTDLNNCGKCHSGDYFYRAILKLETVEDDALMDVAREDQTPIVCAICHNPHERTGNAVDPGDGRDFQLRYPQVAYPSPASEIDVTTDPTRFNICGQCHHDRGRTWTSTSRPPHGSIQANFYTGEMPVPDDTDPFVTSRISVHSFAAEQCSTCHMYRQDFTDELAPAISGHTFRVDPQGCANTGCHPSNVQAQAAMTTFQAEVEDRLDDIASRLGDPSTWEYTSAGGPDSTGQGMLSDNIKKIRFLYYWIVSDGSRGIHNPAYAREILDTAEELLDDEGL